MIFYVYLSGKIVLDWPRQIFISIDGLADELGVIEDHNSAIDDEINQEQIDYGFPVEVDIGDMSISGLVTMTFNQDLQVPEQFQSRRLLSEGSYGSDIQHVVKIRT